jgi:hypothetical protein
MPDPMIEHLCPGRCGKQVPNRHLACPPCWARLPRALQEDVTRAYGRRRQDGAWPHIQAVSKAYAWYRNNTKEDT